MLFLSLPFMYPEACLNRMLTSVAAFYLFIYFFVGAF